MVAKILSPKTLTIKIFVTISTVEEEMDSKKTILFGTKVFQFL